VTDSTRQPIRDFESMTSMSSVSREQPEKRWTFVTNHTRVLLSIARDPDARLRDIALIVGITERATQRIVADLIEAGYVSRERIGRRNHYVVNPRLKLRHPSQREQEVGPLLDVLQLPDRLSPS
jgi:DNA-binding MarR family transcriptional regulator